MASLPNRWMGGEISAFTHLVQIQVDDIFALGVAYSITLVMRGTATVILTAVGVRLSWMPRVCTLCWLTIPWLEYWITGHRQALKGQRLEFRVHLMALTTDDRHNMQLNPKHTPSPSVNDRSSSCFYLSIGNDIAYESDFLIFLAHASHDFV